MAKKDSVRGDIYRAMADEFEAKAPVANWRSSRTLEYRPGPIPTRPQTLEYRPGAIPPKPQTMEYRPPVSVIGDSGSVKKFRHRPGMRVAAGKGAKRWK